MNTIISKSVDYSSVHYYARIALREGIKADYDSLRMFLENNITRSYWRFVSALACKLTSYAELSGNGFLKTKFVVDIND